jgi:hypothetical protein
VNKKLIVPVVVVLILGLVAFFIWGGGLGGKKAAIQITTTPTAKVFLGDKEVGMTPFETESIKPGDVDLKLVPEDSSLTTWEKRLTINANTRLIVEKQFSVDLEKEESQILYLEKTNEKTKAGLTLVSIPDGVSVTVDGQMRGFAPVKIDDITAGDRKIVISRPGYKSKEILTRALEGYRLVVEVKLAKEDDGAVEPQQNDNEDQPSVQKDSSGEHIVISDTPTGWLRVRMEPSTTASEAAKVNPGEKFLLLDEQSGWYQIEYEQDQEGWVSATYAEKED